MRRSGHGLLAALLLPLTLVGCQTTLALPAYQGGFDVQGHRGARGLLPENTVPGFARALDLGVNTLELDLGMTLDRVLVVAHDPFVNPGLCLDGHGRPIEGEHGPLLRDLLLFELRAYDCGSLNPDPDRFPEPPRENLPGTPIPTLWEVFDLVERRGDRSTRFNLEIKSAPGGADTLPPRIMAEALVEMVRDAGLRDRVVVQAFDWKVLADVKRADAGIRTVALLSPGTLDPTWNAGLRADEYGGVLGLLEAADFIDDFSPYWRMLVPGADFLGLDPADYQARGIRVVPWTVNDPATMERLIALGVDGLITDRPDLLLQLLHKAQ